jgi:hypothetical protein
MGELGLGPTSRRAAPMSDLNLAPILQKLSMVEGSKGGYGSMTLREDHFNGIMDCKAFLQKEVT